MSVPAEQMTQPTETTTPAAASPEPSVDITFEEIESVLNFDPFAKQQSDEVPASPAATTEPAPAVAVTDPAPTAPIPAAPAPEIEELRNQLAAMTEELAQLRQPPQAPAAPQPPTEDTTPPYEFQIPDALVQHLQSDNPAEVRTGLAAFAQGVARTVHQTISQQVLQQMQQTMTADIPAMIQQSVTSMQVARTVFDDFYGTFQELNQPQLRPLIVNIAQQVVQEKRAKSWSPDLKQEIARRTYATLGRPMPGTQVPAPTQQHSAPAMVTRVPVPAQNNFDLF